MNTGTVTVTLICVSRWVVSLVFNSAKNNYYFQRPIKIFNLSFNLSAGLLFLAELKTWTFRCEYIFHIPLLPVVTQLSVTLVLKVTVTLHDHQLEVEPLARVYRDYLQALHWHDLVSLLLSSWPPL
jgi:hypothetical protein